MLSSTPVGKKCETKKNIKKLTCLETIPLATLETIPLATLETIPLATLETYPLLRLGVEPRIQVSKTHVLTTYTNRAFLVRDSNPRLLGENQVS